MSLISDDPTRFGLYSQSGIPKPRPEYRMALDLKQAAASVQHVLYYGFGDDSLEPETRVLLDNAYRGLREAVIHYFGEGEAGLFYQPAEPETKPEPTEAKRRIGIPFAKKSK